MATSKRPALRKHDRVTLAAHKSVIPPYDGKPFVLRDTVLTVSHLTGTGSKRNPWHVVVTDGTHFWHLEPDDVARVNEGSSHHATKKKSPAQLSREIAASLASNVKTATRRSHTGPLDGAALAEALPAYKGWTPAWEYPGFLAFHRGDLSVFGTPDYHHPGTIAIDVQRSDGTSIGGGRDLAWPMAKRTPASFMKLMRPVLDAVGKKT